MGEERKGKKKEKREEEMKKAKEGRKEKMWIEEKANE